MTVQDCADDSILYQENQVWHEESYEYLSRRLKEEDTWYNEHEYRQSKWLLQLSPKLQHSEK